MKMILSLLYFFSVCAFSQNLPENLKAQLTSSKELFESYKLKEAAEIYDHEYDENDLLVFVQFDLIHGFDIICTKREIKAYQRRLVIDLSQIFNEAQLRAIAEMGKDPIMNRKKSAKYFEVALSFKQGAVDEEHIVARLRD